MGNQQKPNKQTFFQMKASADNKSADIFIYGEITKYAWEEYGEVSSITFKEQLDALGDDIEMINLYINSPGGSVFETMAMIAMLKRHPAEIIAHIDGVAASAASVLPMIAKQVIMPSNSLLMIHHAMSPAYGNAKQLRKAADDIERISQTMCQYYLDHAGDKLDEAKLNEMLETDTWLTAEQCFEIGLCDVVTESNQSIAYAFDEKWMKQYRNIPEQLVAVMDPTQTAPKISAEEMVWRQQLLEQSKANLTYLDALNL